MPNLLSLMRRWLRPPADCPSTKLIDAAIEKAKVSAIKTARVAAGSFYGFAFTDDQWANIGAMWEKRWY